MEVSHDDIPQCAHVSRLILLNTIANKKSILKHQVTLFPRQTAVGCAVKLKEGGWP